MTEEEAIEMANEGIKQARLDLRQEQPRMRVSALDIILGKKSPGTDWKEYLSKKDEHCPYWQKLDALGDVAAWEKSEAYMALFNEWRKERAKEYFPNDFHNNQLWLNYIIAKEKSDFIDEELEMWHPRHEAEWEEDFDPEWEKEIKDDTN